MSSEIYGKILSQETEPLLSIARAISGEPLLVHLQEEISSPKSDLVLLLPYTIHGLLGISATFIWSTFISMRPDNTVHVGLGIIQAKSEERWVHPGLLALVSAWDRGSWAPLPYMRLTCPTTLGILRCHSPSTRYS